MDPSTAPSSANATDAAEKPVTSQAAVVNDEPTYVYGPFCMLWSLAELLTLPPNYNRVILIFGWRAYSAQSLLYVEIDANVGHSGGKDAHSPQIR